MTYSIKGNFRRNLDSVSALLQLKSVYRILENMLAFAIIFYLSVMGALDATSNSPWYHNDQAEEVPIYKWSPLWFRDYPLKRYEEEKMQDKWPLWLQRNGYYTYKKRTTASEWCSPELSPCNPYSARPQCCTGLKCSVFDFQFTCVQLRSENTYQNFQKVL